MAIHTFVSLGVLVHATLLSPPAIAAPLSGTADSASHSELNVAESSGTSALEAAVLLEHRGSGRCTLNNCSDAP